MYEWPQKLDVVELFKNRQLEALTFAEYTIYLQFEDNLSITVFSNSKFYDGNLIEEINFPIKGTHLVSAIGLELINAELINNKDLYLYFQNEKKLFINGSVREFECYCIKFKGQEFFV